VAIVSVPGIRLSLMQLDVDPTSFELLCARVVLGSFAVIVVVIYRPGSEAVSSTFFDDLSEILERVHGWPP